MVIVTQHPQASTRLHGLDALRLFLMLLGIPYHAAMIYGVDQSWMIRSHVVSPLLTIVAVALHSFRMASFFVLSGFFAALVLHRRDRTTWVRGRVLQLGIPLLTCIVLFTPLQLFIGILNDQLHPMADLHNALRTVVRILAHPGKLWVLHLWFLIDLMLISIMFGLLWPALLTRPTTMLLDMIERLAQRHPHGAEAVMLAFFLGVALVLQALHSVMHVKEITLFSGLIQVQSTLYFSAFFLFGAFLQMRPGLLAWFRQFSASNLLIGLVALVLSIIAAGSASHIAQVGLMFLQTAAGICITRLLFWLAMGRLDRSNHMVRNAADAALTVYLTHHPIIVMLGFVCVHLAITPLLAWCLIVALTVPLTMAFHFYLVAPNRVMSLLFNGRINPSRVSVRKPGHVSAG